MKVNAIASDSVAGWMPDIVSVALVPSRVPRRQPKRRVIEKAEHDSSERVAAGCFLLLQCELWLDAWRDLCRQAKRARCSLKRGCDSVCTCSVHYCTSCRSIRLDCWQGVGRVSGGVARRRGGAKHVRRGEASTAAFTAAVVDASQHVSRASNPRSRVVHDDDVYSHRKASGETSECTAAAAAAAAVAG